MVKRLRRLLAAWIDPGPPPVAKEAPRQWGAGKGLEMPASVLERVGTDAPVSSPIREWLPGEWGGWTHWGRYL